MTIVDFSGSVCNRTTQHSCPRACHRKHQNPITKHQRITKLQHQAEGASRPLELEYWSFPGVWVLVFGVFAIELKLDRVSFELII